MTKKKKGEKSGPAVPGKKHTELKEAKQLGWGGGGGENKQREKRKIKDRCLMQGKKTWRAFRKNPIL